MKNRIKKNTKTPMLAALLCVALLIVSIFLPYMTAEADYRELVEAMEQDASFSLIDFAKIYKERNEDYFVKIIGILVGLGVISAVFAVCRKPILVMFMDILTTAWTVMICLIFSDCAHGYKFGIGRTMIFVACAGLLISAIWMLAAKNKAKKAAKRTERKRLAAENSNNQKNMNR